MGSFSSNLQVEDPSSMESSDPAVTDENQQAGEPNSWDSSSTGGGAGGGGGSR